MKINLQILQNYSGQEIPAVLLTIHSQKYIFNVPETFQRFLKVQKCKMSKSPIIFFSRLKPTHLSGFFGLLFTLYEHGQAEGSKVYGPQNTAAFFENIQGFIGLKMLPFSFFDFSRNVCLLGKVTAQNDTNKKVKLSVKESLKVKLPFKPEIFTNPRRFLNGFCSVDDCNHNASDGFYSNKKVFVDGNITIYPLSIESQEGESVTFLCVPHRHLAKIDKEKIKEFELQGKDLKSLTSGNKVILADGKEICLSDIQLPCEHSSAFLIIDCPNEETAFKLSKSEALSKAINEEVQFSIRMVLHLVPINVLKSDVYQDLLKKFNQEMVEHIFVRNPEIGHEVISFEEKEKISSLFHSQYLHQKLTNIFPKNFRFQSNNEENCFIASEVGFGSFSEILPKFLKWKFTRNYFEYTISPIKRIGYSYMGFGPEFKPIELEFSNELMEQIQNFNENFTKKVLSEYPTILFLGTGSQMPGPYRNVSSILIKFPNEKIMLLDCGEGTYCQLIEHFGKENIKTVLSNIFAVYITHFHGDHHLGFIELLSQRRELGTNNKIFLIIPENMIFWVKTLNQFFGNLGAEVILNSEFCSSFQANFQGSEKYSGQTLSKDSSGLFIDSDYSLSLIWKEINLIKNNAEYQMKVKEFKACLNSHGITNFEAPVVIHCDFSYGVVIDFQNIRLISYSGDCRPSPDFIEKSKNCSVCIHEATYNSDLVEKAKNFLHSTVGEAVDVGIQTNSWRTIITHFSQRYSKKNFFETELENIQQLGNEKTLQHFKEQTIIAFDHLEGNFEDLDSYPQLTQLIASLMPKDSKENEEIN